MNQGYQHSAHHITDITARAAHTARGREFGRATAKSLGDWLFILVLCLPGLGILALFILAFLRRGYMG